jgi:hypothetical protein
MNKIVARFQDGRMVKGVTSDFLATKDRFHIAPLGADPAGRPVEVLMSGLKAVFFVRDLKGRPDHHKSNSFDPANPPVGRRLRVVFNDGEVLVGTTQGYQPGRPGFFVVPVDAKSNNERCYVVSSAIKDVSFI